MYKKILRFGLITAVTGLLQVAVFAQTGPRIGTIGDRVIDNNFLAVIQDIFPGFSFTYDTTILSSTLFKNYSVNMYLAERAKTELDTALPIFKEVREAQQILAAKMLGSYLHNKLLADVKVTEEDAHNFYNNNRTRFTKFGTTSYLQAYMKDTLGAFTQVKKEIELRKNKPADSLRNSKVSKQDFSISFEGLSELNPYASLYPLLRNVKQGTYIGPVKVIGGEGYYYYYVIVATPEMNQTYEEAKAACLEACREKKVSDLENALLKAASVKYGITLNPSFFFGDPAQNYRIK